MQSATPDSLLIPVWPLSLSLATTHKISVDFSSSPYLDVSVQEVPFVYLWIQYTIHELLSCGLLHSDICGSMFAYNSPQLFAVNHVLLRFPMPRHPPCALFSFTICFPFVTLCSLYNCSFPDLLIFNFLKNRVVSLDCISFGIQFSSFFSVTLWEQKPVNKSSFIYSFLLSFGGHKWTRTTDLTLIRRAL